MTSNIGKTAFRYDHMSDLVKINAVIFGAGIYYSDSTVWVLTFLASFTFMYYMVLNHELGGRRKLEKKESTEAALENTVPVTHQRMRNRFKIISYIVKYKWFTYVIYNIRSVVFTINGHTLLLFLLIPFGKAVVVPCFLYFISISLVGGASLIRELSSMAK